MDNLAETHDATARSEKFLALARLVKEHVKEEETQLFPKLDAKRADFGDLGAQLRDRKEGLSRVSLFL
jgi:hemerythrin superfamily protein